MTQPTEEAAIDTRPWCRDHRGQDSSFDEFLMLIESFHGYPAPGVLIGAKMVDIAMSRMPTGVPIESPFGHSGDLPGMRGGLPCRPWPHLPGMPTRSGLSFAGEN
jgi:hypothetical protein